MYKVNVLRIAIFLSVLVHVNVYASACVKHSDESTRTPLVELYTSEGCSSCPPADKWLSALVPKVVAAEELVALAFHVDYWDRLGWRDRFAAPAYTSRQYEVAKINRSGFVFTPQVVVAGRNYGAWGGSSVQKELRAERALLPDANIVLTQKPVAADKAEFEVQAQLRQGVSAKEVRIYAALFQNGLVSDVGKGENSGSRLRHDYVVRSLLASKVIDQSGKIKFKDSFVLAEDGRVGEMGVAVFAQDVKTGAVLQAMSAPLCVNK